MSAVLMLVIGLPLVGLTWSRFQDQDERVVNATFDFRVAEVIEAIEGRMRDHADILLGGVGLFNASALVERDEWHSYIESLQLRDHYPGILGVGYAQAIKPADLRSHIAAVRAEGYPSYTVSPPGARDLYTSILYLEPFSGRNLAAFGYDMFSEPTRHQAMLMAAETAKPAVSGRVTLVQENEGPVQVGFLMYTPVFQKNYPLDSPAQRLRALKGFVYSPYRMNDLMSGILPSRDADVGFAIYDGTLTADDPALNDESRMFVSDAGESKSHRFESTIVLSVYGHTWSVHLYALPEFVANTQRGSGQAVAWVPILGGIIVLMMALLIFTNERRRASAELLADNLDVRTRAIVETAMDGIITMDDKGTLETFNPSASRLFGHDAADVAGRNVAMLIADLDYDKPDADVAGRPSTAAATIVGGERTATGRRKDGSTFPLEVSMSKMMVAGQPMFTGIVRDITERRAVEKTHSEFIATVSHELRTPLTSIKASLGLIKSGVAGSLPESVQKMFAIAYANSERLVLLINDILDLEKVEAGKMDLRMAPVDLGTMLGEAIEAYREYGRERGISFVLSGDLPGAVVEGDYDRLMQVLANVMSNAAKFSPDGERVDLKLSRLTDSFRIEVADRGPGIPVAFRRRIFQRFAQADSSSTRQKGGTGLGLSIAKGIVDQHGGTLGFTSEVGTGTTFYIELPARVESRQEQWQDRGVAIEAAS